MSTHEWDENCGYCGKWGDHYECRKKAAEEAVALEAISQIHADTQ